MKRDAAVGFLLLLCASSAPFSLPAAEDGRRLTLDEALAIALKQMGKDYV